MRIRIAAPKPFNGTGSIAGETGRLGKGAPFSFVLEAFASWSIAVAACQEKKIWTLNLFVRGPFYDTVALLLRQSGQT